MRSVVAALFFFGAGHAQAVEFCIQTTAELQALVDQNFQAGGLQGDHYVKLVKNTYEIQSPDMVVFNGLLTVEGGYEADCEGRTPGAEDTVIRDVTGTGRPSFHAFNGGDVVMRDLTLSGYSGAFVWPQGESASVVIQRVAFLFTGVAWDGLQVFPTDGTVSLENVVVDAATSTPTQCALRADSPGEMLLSFVTLRNRAAGRGACLSAAGALTLTNSIVLSDGPDFEAPEGVLLRNSSVGELPAVLLPGSADNSTQPIAFEVTNSPLRRNRPADQAAQPARDSGIALAVGLDLLGQPRAVGAAPDRGAFELQAGDPDRVFSSGFE